MTKLSALDNLLERYSSFIFATARKHGVTPYELNKAVREGRLRKSDRGVYIAQGYLEDEMTILSQRFSRGVFAAETALSFYDLSDEIPWRYKMYFPQGYHPAPGSLAKNFIVPTFRTGKYYTTGIVQQKTPDGNAIYMYSMERALVDVWNDPHAQPYVKNDALKRYLKLKRERSYLLTELEQKLYPESALTSVMAVILQ